MRIEQLRYLSDIQNTHSISKTAKRFFVSQQAMSNSLKQLESELKITLLERSASGVILTEHAEALLKCTNPFLHDYDALIEQFNAQLEEPPETVRRIKVYTSSVLAGTVLPKAIATFSKKYPKIKISIKEVTHKEVFPAIIQNECDLAFFTINEEYFLEQLKIYNSTLFKYNIILTDRLVGCVSSKSSLAKKEIISQNDIASRVFTYLNIVPVSKGIAKQSGVALYTAHNIHFHKQVLREMDAVSLMPHYAYINLLDNKYFVAKPLEGAQQIIYHTVIYASSDPQYIFREFVNIVTSFL